MVGLPVLGHRRRPIARGRARQAAARCARAPVRRPEHAVESAAGGPRPRPVTAGSQRPLPDLGPALLARRPDPPGDLPRPASSSQPLLLTVVYDCKPAAALLQSGAAPVERFELLLLYRRGVEYIQRHGIEFNTVRVPSYGKRSGEVDCHPLTEAVARRANDGADAAASVALARGRWRVQAGHCRA